MKSLNSTRRHLEMPDRNNEASVFKYLHKFHDYLRCFFYYVGYKVGSSPSYFIIIPFFLTLLGLTGFQRMHYERDPEHLFSPNDGAGRRERDIVETYFKLNYSYNYNPSRMIRWDPFGKVYLSAKDGGNILRSELWDEIDFLDRSIQNLTITEDGRVYTFWDLCSKREDKCFGNNVLNLKEYIPKIENGSMFINYPLMLNPLVVPHAFGGASVNESEGVLMSSKAIQLFYFLKNGDIEENRRSVLWEVAFLNFLRNVELKNIKLTYFVSKSLEYELDANTKSVEPYLIFSVSLMVGFSIVSVALGDWVRSKLSIGVFGVISAMMACIAGFGLLMYCGVDIIGINMAVPFLIMGIGIDDMFVVLSAWHRTSILNSVPERMAEAYSEAAVSITITSLTNMLSFLIGVTTPFPAVKIFCLYIGVVTFLCYVWFITFFGGILALSGYNESEQKHCITLKPVLPVSQTKERSWMYKIWCSGGIDAKNPKNPIDNQPHSIMKFFRDYLGTALNIPAVKALLILVFLLYLGGAIYGIINVKEGLERRKLVLDNSYLASHFDEEDKLFRKYPYVYQVILHGNLTYSDPKQMKEILRLHKKFEELENIGSRLFTQSWMRGFYRYLYRRPQLRKNITDEKTYINTLMTRYLRPSSHEYYDIALNEDQSQIIASRFVIQGYNMTQLNDDRKMLVLLRDIAKTSSLNVTVYNPLFVYFDQYLIVNSTTIQTITMAAIIMMFISFLFIPNLLCSFCVGFSIISIEIGVIGYMSLLGVNLDSISMINLIMCIGFSVDFSAHISYAYLTASSPTADGKVKECLYSLGLPVLQGGVSTIVGMLVLALAPSYVFLTFFKMIFLVIIFGLLHGLLLLPVMLSLLGPGSALMRRFEKKTEPSEQEFKTSPAYGAQEIIPKFSCSTPKFSITKPEDDCDSLDKDLGIGSSGSSSHGSVEDCNESNLPMSDLESDLDAQSRRSTTEDHEGNLNRGYVDDENEDGKYGCIKL